MALSIERQNKITQALKDTGVLAKVTEIQDKFAQQFDLNDFGAIHQHYDDSIANKELEGMGVGASADSLNVILDAMVKDRANMVDIELFLMQSLSLQLPKLYNFLKAGCFIEIGGNVKELEHYPLNITYENDDATVTHIFSNPLEYYKHEVAECEKQFAPTSSIDAEINQYMVGIEREISELKYTIVPEIAREEL